MVNAPGFGSPPSWFNSHLVPFWEITKIEIKLKPGLKANHQAEKLSLAQWLITHQALDHHPPGSIPPNQTQTQIKIEIKIEIKISS